MGMITIILLPILGAMLLAWGLSQVYMDLRTAKQRKVVDRLSEASTSSGRKEKEVRDSLLRKRAGDAHRSFLDSVMSRMRVVRKLQCVLDQADVDWAAPRMLINLAALALAVAAVMITLQFGGVSVAAAVVGTLGLPLLWLLHRRKKRIRIFVEQLPDAFDLMGQALRAGHALAGSIQLISQQMPSPIAKEFARVFHEQNLGIKIEEALLAREQPEGEPAGERNKRP